jgi:hypothetical protein
MQIIKVLAVVSVFITTGCAYNAPVDVTPAYNVYSNYDDKLAGRYALYVDAEEMQSEGRTRGMACAAHSYPYDGRDPFKQSVLATFQNIVEDVELVDFQLDTDALVAQGFQAQLSVEVESSEVDLTVHAGFWSSEIEADAEIVASVRAMGKSGVLLGSSIEGSDDAVADAGGFCEGASTAMQEALGGAIKKTMERLGERLANARKLREAAIDMGMGESE